jgi:hypothetical protein
MPEPRAIAWEEAVLKRLAPTVAYPATPEMAPAVRRRLSEPPALRGGPGRAFVPRLALVVVVLLAAFGFALVVSSETRQAVADFLGLGVKGERIEQLPTPAPGVTPTALPTPPRLDDIARRITLEEAATRLGFAIAKPAGADEPTAIYTLNAPADTVVILRYPGFDLWEFATDQGFILKKGFNGTVVENAVKGATAYWITGGVRILSFVDASGNEVAGTQRTTDGTALLWSRNGKYYRIEGVGDLEGAKRIAETVQ